MAANRTSSGHDRPTNVSKKKFTIQALTDRWKWLNLKWLGYWLIALGTLTGATITALDLRLVSNLERQAQATFFEMRGSVKPPDNIVILAIDEESLAQGQSYQADPQKLAHLKPLESWPWRRIAYAKAIDRLMAAGAKAVAIDLIFADPSIYGAADDVALKQTLQRYPGRVTLAAMYADSETPQGPLTQRVLPDASLFPNGNHAANPLLSTGFINYLPDVDGRIHHFASEYQKQIIQPLGLGKALPSFDEAILQAAAIPYPVPKGNEIFFYGPRNTFPSIPFFYVLEPHEWQTSLQKGKFFKDKIVIIGPTATILQDLHRTPFSGNWRYPTLMPGVEVHAHAIATLMENRAITDAIPSPLYQGLLILVGVSLASGFVSRISQRPVKRALWALAIAAAWAGIGYVSLIGMGAIIPVAVPVLLIALSGLVHLGTGIIREQLEKHHLRRTLERYVSAPIVQEILNQPEDFRALLQGRKINAAVMFCDIRGFTTLSFKLPPEQLVAQLNVYLNVMVAAIVDARGTVDKFIGDAVMAEFGTPVSQGAKADALNAIKAALNMRKALVTLRQQWQQQGQPILFNGIGISFGEVIAGNIGSIQRLEYTVIGDTVNIASRVEGLTKEFGTDILITDSLYELVQTEVDAVFLGEHPLRGRDSKVGLYSLVGLKGEDPTLYHEVQKDLRASQAKRASA
ncbi:MAG: adenylate/guanylate cyclase domain-containing protein [Scytolyngbya sp. HA4215-MV1]|jgi:adenylate cyclase|nr:adenylate/guanylate cyclase domain-containing protein [Scytolyngbya sp. HA4215-MV1]